MKEKPLVGMQKYVHWFGYIESEPNRDGDLFPAWHCIYCGHIRYGSTIKHCPACNNYPAWSYTKPLFSIYIRYGIKKIRAYFKHFLLVISNQL